MTRGGRALPDILPDAAGGCRHGADGLRPGHHQGIGIQLWHAAGDRAAGGGEGDAGRTEVAWSETAALLRGALEAMMARGKAALGDKTVLDALDAAAGAAEGRTDGRRSYRRQPTRSKRRWTGCAACRRGSAARASSASDPSGSTIRECGRSEKCCAASDSTSRPPPSAAGYHAASDGGRFLICRIKCRKRHSFKRAGMCTTPRNGFSRFRSQLSQTGGGRGSFSLTCRSRSRTPFGLLI